MNYHFNKSTNTIQTLEFGELNVKLSKNYYENTRNNKENSKNFN